MKVEIDLQLMSSSERGRPGDNNKLTTEDRLQLDATRARVDLTFGVDLGNCRANLRGWG